MIKAQPRLASQYGTHGWAPIHVAVARNDLAATRLLLEHGADPNAVDRFRHARVVLAFARAPPCD